MEAFCRFKFSLDIPFASTSCLQTVKWKVWNQICLRMILVNNNVLRRNPARALPKTFSGNYLSATMCQIECCYSCCYSLGCWVCCGFCCCFLSAPGAICVMLLFLAQDSYYECLECCFWVFFWGGWFFVGLRVQVEVTLQPKFGFTRGCWKFCLSLLSVVRKTMPIV